MADFLPRRDDLLVMWGANFERFIAADPQRYGISAAQAAEFSDVQQAFARAHEANDPSIRSRTSAARKDEARQAMKTVARRLSRIVHATPGVSDAMKIALGLTVRSAQHRPRNALGAGGVPGAGAPRVVVETTMARRAHLRLRDPHSPGAGRPRGTIGAMIFSHVGDQPSARPSDWTFVCNTTRTACTVAIPAHLPPGTKVWFSAAWLDSRLQHGRWGAPAMAYVPFGGVATTNKTLPAIAA